MHTDPLVLALRLARTFDALGIPYLIGGSVATSIHGELRTTQDIDFVAQFRESHVQPFVEALLAGVDAGGCVALDADSRSREAGARPA